MVSLPSIYVREILERAINRGRIDKMLENIINDIIQTVDENNFDVEDIIDIKCQNLSEREKRFVRTQVLSRGMTQVENPQNRK